MCCNCSETIDVMSLQGSCYCSVLWGWWLQTNISYTSEGEQTAPTPHQPQLCSPWNPRSDPTPSPQTRGERLVPQCFQTDFSTCRNTSRDYLKTSFTWIIRSYLKRTFSSPVTIISLVCDTPDHPRAWEAAICTGPSTLPMEVVLSANCQCQPQPLGNYC